MWSNYIILFMSVCWKQACLCLVMLSRSESSRMSRSCFMVLKIFICIGCWCLCILRMNKLMLSSSQQGRISRESIVDSQKHILASLRCTLSYHLLVRAQEACISSDRMGKSRTCHRRMEDSMDISCFIRLPIWSLNLSAWDNLGGSPSPTMAGYCKSTYLGWILNSYTLSKA